MASNSIVTAGRNLHGLSRAMQGHFGVNISSLRHCCRVETQLRHKPVRLHSWNHVHQRALHRAVAAATCTDDLARRQQKLSTKAFLPYRDSYLICNHSVIGRRILSGRCSYNTNIKLFHTLATCGNCNLMDCLGPPGAYRPLGGQLSENGLWGTIVIRTLKIGASTQKDESKVEKTVKALKEQAAEDTKAVDAVPEVEVKEAPVAAVVPQKSLWQRFVAELKHYYHGFRLLLIDIKVCVRLLWSVMNGKALSRRGRRQLVRTTADLFRLVPFLVFVVVPFMEFLLPVAVKLFPGMLPSTFQEENKEQEKSRKRLKVKLEMAKFLQDTIEETALQRKGKGTTNTAAEFAEFMERIRTSGAQTSTEEIRRYSKLFEDEITLDNLNRGQLTALCKLLELTTFGTNNFLRFQLRLKLRQLEADDRIIRKEGLNALNVWELQEACRARGMRAIGVPEARLKTQLEQWLDMHLNEKIPTSLLLLSRALYLPETLSTEDQLKATISVLPETTAEEAKIKISEVAGERVDNKAKLELIRQEQEALKAEEEEKKKEEAEAAEAEAMIQRAKERLETVPPTAEPVAPGTAAAGTPSEEQLIDVAPIVEEKADEVIVEKIPEISTKDLEEIEEALENIAEEKKIAMEKEELEHLKKDVNVYNEDLEDLKEVMLATGVQLDEIKVSKAAQRLSKRVNRMIEQMGSAIDDLYAEKEALIEDIELKEVKVKRSAELKRDAQMRQKVLDQITEKKDNLISINELVLAMKRLQKLPDDTKLEWIAHVLDEDKDGAIDLELAHKVIENLGKENVKIGAGHMTEIMELIKKEAIINETEELEKQKEKVEKEEKMDDVEEVQQKQ